MTLIRLNKFLADAGIASRRNAEKLILDGKITVNGEKVEELGTKVDPATDEVCFNKEQVMISDQKPIVMMLNKPVGYTCTTRAFHGEENILNLIDIDERVYPVGRLDKNSEGLIILTNDGDLTLKLTHPRYEKEKEYEVVVDREIEEDQLQALRSGVRIEGIKTLPAKVTQTASDKFNIILKEGRKRQIRQMCRLVCLEVVNLKRIRINNLELGNLQVGQYKKLDQKQIQKLTDEKTKRKDF